MSTQQPQGGGAPAPAEQIVARLRPHARRLIPSAVVVVAAAGLLGYFAGNLPEMWQNMAVVIGGLLLISFAGIAPLLVWLSTRYIITTRRLVVRRGVITRIHQDLLHSRGYDVSVRQGPGQRMFGSGHVLVNVGLDSPVTLRDVPGALLVSEALQDLMEDNRNPVAARRQQVESATTGRRPAAGPTTRLPAATPVTAATSILRDTGEL